MSASDLVLGTLVEVGMFTAFGLAMYRLLGGRFLVPTRQIVAPYNRGVIVEGSGAVRVVEPGTCWIKPKQRLVLCDVRPRPLQMVGIESVGADGGVVRVSLSGEYYVSDPATFIAVSREASNSFVAAVRKAIFDAAKEQASTTIAAAPELLTARIRQLVAPDGKKFGMDFLNLQVWEAVQVGWLRHVPEISQPPIVH